MLVICAASAAADPRYRVEEERAKGPGAPLLLVLRDEVAGLEAAVAPSKGGELSSLRVRHRGQWIELLYRARDYTPVASWQGKAPLLWPATGRNRLAGEAPDPADRAGSYSWRGRRYPMTIHGFARDLAWRVLTRQAGPSAASVALGLEDTEETRQSYPFGFELRVEYRVAGGRLHVDYTVRASGGNTEDMFFSIGNHITFRVPFLEGTDPESMLFQTPSTVEYLKSAQRFPTGESKPRSFAEPARRRDFDAREAISLGGYEDKPSMRLADPRGLAVRITHEATSVPAEPVVLFNIWGDAREGYFSPEPWVGLQNSLNLQKGLVRLAPGERWEWKLELTIE